MASDDALVAETTPTPRRQANSSFLRLVYALASKAQSHHDLIRWLDTATIEDLRMAYPVLLNWSIWQMQAAASSTDGDEDTNTPAVDVVRKILERIGEATTNASSKTVLCLRMSLSGFLHANTSILQDLPVLRDLVRDDNPLFALTDEPLAASTMKMVNNDDKLLPGDACQTYIRDSIQVLHPFTGEVASKMQVLKVFDTSKTKPAWIRYFGVSADDNEEKKGQPQYTPLSPDVIGKQGDDLRNDEAIRFIAKLCNALWAVAPVDWKLGKPPTVFCYNVVVASVDSGYLQHVPGKTFFELGESVPATEGDNQSAEGKIGWDNVNIEKLAPSLVGSYVAHFVLGTRDRHEHNMMVVGDLQKDPKLMQIDFGYVLMEYPGGVHFDTPRLTMPVPLINRLNEINRDDTEETSLMDDLQQDMLAAYLVLRKHDAEEIIQFSKIMLSTSHDPAGVETFFRGNHSLRTCDTESYSADHFAHKIESQLSRFVFRREVRQKMVASYYTFYRGVEFSKNFRTKSKRRLLAKRAAETMHLPLRGTEPEKRRGGHRRSLSANDLPINFRNVQADGDEESEDLDVWYDSMQGSIRHFSVEDDSDSVGERSTQSEPDFL